MIQAFVIFLLHKPTLVIASNIFQSHKTPNVNVTMCTGAEVYTFYT